MPEHRQRRHRRPGPQALTAADSDRNPLTSAAHSAGRPANGRCPAGSSANRAPGRASPGSRRASTRGRRCAPVPGVVRGAGQDGPHGRRNDLARRTPGDRLRGHRVVLARGLTPDELVGRLPEAVHGMTPGEVAVGEHTSDSLLEWTDDTYGDVYAAMGLRLGRAGEWTYAVAYGGWQGEFGSLTPLSRDGAHVCVLEFEEENGKPVPPQFEYPHDGRLLSARNLHLDGSWGYEGVEGDPATAGRLQELLTATGLPDHELDNREVHRTALGVVERFFGLSLPKEPIVHGILPAVVLESGFPNPARD
ncbi:DUF6461 domain-containing protein [Streptomyces sp. NPDC001502]|uniref:DUF6461 domain-containing protein n=1 Tax=Streptomyces sp. NPDC001502 TaxID=3364578 RepID=UPI0036B18761